MRFKLTVLLALIASVLLASTALAADLSKKAPLTKGAQISETNISGSAPPSTLPPVGSRGSHGGLDEVIISEDFEAYAEGELPPGWIQVDEDGGSCSQFGRASTWQVFDYGENAHGGTKVAMCHYNDGGLANEDWLIIPVGVLEAPISFSYWRASQQVEYSDSYELRISTTGVDPEDFTDLIINEDDMPEAWVQQTFDLSTYAGAPFYIAFFYNSVDRFVIKVDDVLLEGTPGTAEVGSLAGTVTDSETSNPLQGVNVTIIGSTQSGTTDAAGDYLVEDIIVGTYDVEFSKEGYYPTEEEDVVITEGQTATLNVTMDPLPPVIENDDCDSPYVLPEGNGVYPYSTENATVDGSVADLPDGPPPAGCDENENGIVFAADIWVSWTAVADGDLIVSTCNDANYDTRLACYSNGTATCPGCPTTNDDFVACNDDGPGCGTTSLMEFEVDDGACYLIRVGGWNTAIGTGNLTIDFEGEPIPNLEVTPASVDFEDVPVGTTDDMVITLENTGAAVLQVTSITVPAGYTVTPTAHGIPAGSSRTSTITFAPTAEQTYSGNITITSNDPDSPHEISITGNGISDVDEYVGVVTDYYVATSYPNPFNPETTISFAIPKSEYVSVAVFNTVGQQVAVLNNGRLDAGIHNFTFSGADLPSGLYFTRIEADGFSQTLKNVLMK